MIRKRKLAIKLKFSVIVMCAFLFGCAKSNDKKVLEILEGQWHIDSFTYLNRYDLIGCSPGSSLYFYKDSILLPTTQYCDSIFLRDSNRDGIGKILYKNKDDIRLYVNTENKMFNDTLNIKFIDDRNNKLVRLEIFSKDTYVLCTKDGFHSYDDLRKEVIGVATVSEAPVGGKLYTGRR
jgi:hypothetical protein